LIDGRCVLSGKFARDFPRGLPLVHATGHGTALVDASCNLVNKLFNSDLSFRAVSITGYGDGKSFRWRVYIEAFGLAVERIGADQNRLIIDALLDIYNILRR
jgi:hypothetical protein